MKKFTFTDLMIIIGILAILTVLIIPSIGTARDKARQKQCTGNLKQIGLAMHMYFNSKKETLMPLITGDINSSVDSNNAYNLWSLSRNSLNCYAKHQKKVNTTPKKENSYFFCNASPSGMKSNVEFILIESSNIPIAGDKTLHSTGDKANILFGDGHIEPSRFNAKTIKP
ncbi:DUF1559 domain-containing protein [Lentisphaera profundi]|uniref:DUF1559 domain-containing protein n=1 Tax=Lentisphaera profundi TaxID=1658616 RepID=A0ABY7VN92_9BACT|nr:DUF1559 domain-containing protein [Lentisphaera profundi]WDE95570.1 DUF1559 domain-containing protein [Lentisphaera profundi]